MKVIEDLDQRIKEHAEEMARLTSIRAEAMRDLGEETETSPVVSLQQFLDEHNTDFDWLIGGSLARGAIAMLAAESGAGKTCLLVQIALCLAAGRDPFYDARVTGKFPCLYVAAEGARGAFQNRVDTARKTLGVDKSVGWFIHPPNVTDYKIGSANLERMIDKSEAKFVVLDTVSHLWTGDENSSVEWKKGCLQPLLKLVAKYGCTFMLVHHFVKASQERQGWQRARGTSAMFSDLDAFYQLEAVDGDETRMKRALIQSKNKFSTTRRWDLTFDAVNARFG